MREIKFRGLSINGEWAYGLLAKEKNNWFISNKVGKPFAYQIRPETIGEYTNFKSKSGQEIYEGDIIKVKTGKRDFVWPINDSKEIAKGDIGTVYFSLTGCTVSFCKKEKVIYIGLHDLMSDSESLGGMEKACCVVIGNVYENLKLLERGIDNAKKG